MADGPDVQNPLKNLQETKTSTLRLKEPVIYTSSTPTAVLLKKWVSGIFFNGVDVIE